MLVTILFPKSTLESDALYSCYAEEVSIPSVREGWHMWWHPYGEAMLPEHVTVVHPMNLPWGSDTNLDYLDQALIYNWLDQANMYHVMMETGNFIYATACKLLGACSYADSHFHILSTVSTHSCSWSSNAICATSSVERQQSVLVLGDTASLQKDTRNGWPGTKCSCLQGYFKFGENKGLPAGHESLKCLSSRLPLWIGDPHFDNKVSRALYHIKLHTICSLKLQCHDPSWVQIRQDVGQKGKEFAFNQTWHCTPTQPCVVQSNTMMLHGLREHRSGLSLIDLKSAFYPDMQSVCICICNCTSATILHSLSGGDHLKV